MPHLVHWNCFAILPLGAAQWHVSPKALFVDSRKPMGGELDQSWRRNRGQWRCYPLCLSIEFLFVVFSENAHCVHLIKFMSSDRAQRRGWQFIYFAQRRRLCHAVHCRGSERERVQVEQWRGRKIREIENHCSNHPGSKRGCKWRGAKSCAHRSAGLAMCTMCLCALSSMALQRVLLIVNLCGHNYIRAGCVGART